jgi:serine protease Do
MNVTSNRAKWLASIAVIAGIFLLGMGAERIISYSQRSDSFDSVLIPNASAQVQSAEDIPTVVEKAVPAVVNISSKKITENRQLASPLLQNPFFRDFWGEDFYRRFNIPRESVERSLGSGVVVSEDGYILTNNHLVENANEVKVALPDKREFDAKIVGTDQRSDVAVLKIDAKNLPTITMGSSANLRLGQTVLAIGYPFQVGQTVTMGIISALGRELERVDADFIQTDAAINPGNSGGALINAKGELIGINSAIYTRTGGYMGIGFAIPIDLARSVMDDLISHGRVVRGYMGVGIDDVTPENAEFYGLTDAKGVIITNVQKGSPAMKAGIKNGDVVVSFRGKDVKTRNEFRRMVADTDPGTNAAIAVLRDGKKKELSVSIGELPRSGAENVSEGKEAESTLFSGIELDNLTDDYRAQLQLPSELQGVVITALDDNSVAAEAGLTRGDVIVEVNRHPVQNLDEFSALEKKTQGGKALLLVYRDGGYFTVVLKS